ncbi:MAG: ATP-binding cassette domain-containing protein, partial [Anaerolineaceae bacterium]
MALISLQDVSLGFGGPLLLENINLQVERGEWIGLLGRNGMGKSSLLKIISGEIISDDGVVAVQQNIKISYLPQDVPVGLKGSIGEIVAGGLEKTSVSQQPEDDHWQQQLDVEKILSRMQLEAKTPF